MSERVTHSHIPVPAITHGTLARAYPRVKKQCDFVLIILVQGFCPLKIKITQFPDGFRLNRCAAQTLYSVLL